jgi:putative membrane protein
VRQDGACGHLADGGVTAGLWLREQIAITQWTEASRAMSEQQAGGHPDRFEVRVTAESHFAWLRTRLALERTMMAWARTAVALIGFGFAIVQFLDTMLELPGARPVRFPDAPRYLGLALIGCGVAALVIALWEYRWMRRYLWSGSYAAIAGTTTGGRQTPLYAAAIVLILVGTFAFFAVLLRLV